MVDERIVFTALHARDYEDTVSFYRDILGVPLEEEDHGDEGPHFEYSWHEPYFHFAIFPLKPNEEPTHVELSFNNSNVADVHSRAVSAGIQVVTPPGPRPWGFSAEYLDPDGNTVGVTELKS